MKILLVEDEKILRISLDKTLRKAKFAVHSCDRGDTAISILQKETFDVILTDIRLPGSDGLEILQFVQKSLPTTKVILMTAFGSVESAVGALKMGAHDYLTKPFTQDELLHRLNQLRNLQSIIVENMSLREQLIDRQKLIGNSPKFLKVMDRTQLAAQGDHTVLIEGESGTGKELIVDMIHTLSDRREKPLIKINCSALPESLFESELFGYEKGAFTGATRQHIGRFERAKGGTLFLDDIDDLPKPLQVKLLRVIQEREIERIGGKKTIPVDFRLVAATKVDLRKMMEENIFRDDLFYRLNVITVDVPPLRNRKSDIPLLTAYFLEKHGKGHTVTRVVLQKLTEYSWPGNVRELENVIIQMIALTQGDTLTASLLPSQFVEQASSSKDSEISELNTAIAKSEKTMIVDALEQSKWRQNTAAKKLGIPRTTLRSKMKKYGLVK